MKEYCVDVHIHFDAENVNHVRIMLEEMLMKLRDEHSPNFFDGQYEIITEDKNTISVWGEVEGNN